MNSKNGCWLLYYICQKAVATSAVVATGYCVMKLMRQQFMYSKCVPLHWTIQVLVRTVEADEWQWNTANGVTSLRSIIHGNNLMWLAFLHTVLWNECAAVVVRAENPITADFLWNKETLVPPNSCGYTEYSAIEDVDWPCAESSSCRFCSLFTPYFVLAYQWPLALPRLAARLYTPFIYLCLTFILSFLTL